MSPATFLFVEQNIRMMIKMYEYEVWGNGKINVLVRFYNANGETFGEWTADAEHIPATEEEANGYDWEVENMTYLRENGFKKV